MYCNMFRVCMAAKAAFSIFRRQLTYHDAAFTLCYDPCRPARCQNETSIVSAKSGTGTIDLKYFFGVK
jgi:hypothetical protein